MLLKLLTTVQEEKENKYFCVMIQSMKSFGKINDKYMFDNEEEIKRYMILKIKNFDIYEIPYNNNEMSYRDYEQMNFTELKTELYSRDIYQKIFIFKGNEIF